MAVEHRVANASVEWLAPKNAWGVRLWGKNLTDRIYTMSLNQAPGTTAVAYAAPRTYGVTVGKKF